MKEDETSSNSNSANDDKEPLIKQMIGGCCVCADDSGYCDNPLVYCDGPGCNVAVHQACYGIVHVPEGPWYCRRCECGEKAARVSCSLCPSREGAMKRTENGQWAHVICALYIPEITFTNVRTMEPIVTANIRSDRMNRRCHLCESNHRADQAEKGVCVSCSKSGCKLWFHVTCAQTYGLLCEDHSLSGNNVKYCIYCKNHLAKLANNEYIKLVPAFKPENSISDIAESKSKSSTKSSTKKTTSMNPKPKKSSKEPKEASSSNKTSILSNTINPAPKIEPTEAPSVKESPPVEESNTIGSLLQVVMAERESQTVVKSEATPSTTAQINVNIEAHVQNQVAQASPATAAAPNSEEVAKSKKTKKISNISSILKIETTQVSLSPMNSPIKKTGATKTKRKSLDSSENESSAKKKEKSGATPSAAKKRKHISEMPSSSSSNVVNTSSAPGESNSSLCLDIFGNQLNATAVIPANLKTTLEQDIRATSETVAATTSAGCSSKVTQHMGPPAPTHHSYSLLNDDQSRNESQKQFPETLEDLLMVKWSLDSEFLMEQSQNFDVCSLLNCLYQLKRENRELEAKALELVKKRDSLMLINSKLSIPLEYQLQSNATSDEPAAPTTSSTTPTNTTTKPQPQPQPQSSTSLTENSSNQIQNQNQTTSAHESTSTRATPTNTTPSKIHRPTPIATPTPSITPHAQMQPQPSTTHEISPKPIACHSPNPVNNKPTTSSGTTSPIVAKSITPKSSSNSSKTPKTPKTTPSTDFTSINHLSAPMNINMNMSNITYPPQYAFHAQNDEMKSSSNGLMNTYGKHPQVDMMMMMAAAAANKPDHMNALQAAYLEQINKYPPPPPPLPNHHHHHHPLQHHHHPMNDDSRKFEKINQLLNNNNNSNNSSQNEKPSAYVAPVMIKRPSSSNLVGLTNNTAPMNSSASTPVLSAGGNSNPIVSTSASMPKISGGSGNGNGSGPAVPVAGAGGSSAGSEVFYPLQNILLTPSLTLNYGWQNLLQHVDPSTAGSLLSLIPHLNNLDLLNNLNAPGASQQQQQQQNQRSDSLQSLGNVNSNASNSNTK